MLSQMWRASNFTKLGQNIRQSSKLNAIVWDCRYLASFWNYDGSTASGERKQKPNFALLTPRKTRVILV